MAEQIHIDHEELWAHSERLRVIGQDVYRAADQAAGVHVGDGAFGILMGWLPGVISRFTPDNTDTIRAAAGAIDRTAAGVRALSEDFSDTDRQAAESMNRIGS